MDAAVIGVDPRKAPLLVRVQTGWRWLGGKNTRTIARSTDNESKKRRERTEDEDDDDDDDVYRAPHPHVSIDLPSTPII
jgi:hypothetical protein